MKNKKLLGLTLTSLLSTSCATLSNQEYSTVNKITATAAVVCQEADLTTTVYALNNGSQEANPILGKNPSTDVLVAVKMGLLAINYGWGELFPDTRSFVYGITAGLGCFAAGWNMYAISQHNKQ